MKSIGIATPHARVSYLAMAVAFLLITTLFIGYHATDAHDEVETKFSLTVYFKAREALGRSPPLSPKLKLFSYDDTTVSKIGSPDLPLATWAGLLDGLSLRKPQVILIDKLFSLAPKATPEEEAAIAKLAALDQKIVTTAFVSPSEIKFREPLDTSGASYHLSTYFVAPGVEPMMKDGFVPAANYRMQKPYGPDKRLARAFRTPGHSLNAGFGKAQALLDLAPGVVLPHMALMGARELKVHARQLAVDSEQIVPLDERGRMIVDFPHPLTLYKGAKRLLPLIEAAATGAPMTQVEPGDWVLILPAMYTGNTDFTVTPLGPMPGPFVVAALANSILRRQWVAPLPAARGILVAAVFLGLFLVGFVRWPAWAPLTLVPVLWVTTSIALFAYFDVLTDLTTPTLAFLTAGGFASAQRSGMREKLVLFMRLLKTENERLATELEQAGQIASAFRPHRPPELEGIDIGAFHQSLDGASGDWYAFETSTSGRYLHVIMCDISGHGVQAAIVVSTCKTVLSILQRDRAADFESETFIRYYVELLNATLYKHGRGGHTTTLAGLTIDRDSGKCTFLCAGHPPPIVLRANTPERKGALELLMSSHNILGISPSIDVALGETVLGVRDHLLLFTDGVKFPRNSRRIEKRLRELTLLRPETAAPMLCRMDWGSENAERRAPAAVQDDDVSLVWIATTEDWLRPRHEEKSSA